jgi:ariadne-1
MNNVLECSFCYYSFSKDFPHYKCDRINEWGSKCSIQVCQACFIRWASGKIKSDNIGYKILSCRCNKDISFDIIKSIFPKEDFIEYDEALTRFALEKSKNVIYCPGKDCPNAFIKPKIKRNKRQCRKTTCDMCETELCCLCGELYTLEHAKMKCGPYKKWKNANDEDTISLNNFLSSTTINGHARFKPCPKCKRNVEKADGCNDMRCTNCDTRFCWVCKSIKEVYTCYTCRNNANRII